MATSIDIGSLIARSPERGGRPRIAGTGISVQRIARWYNMGFLPEEIAAEYRHITLAQVHAALAYYLANGAEMDAEIEVEDAEEERIVQEASKDFKRDL